jgi:hypothetical protein
MITTVPLPSWRELATSFAGQRPNDNDLAGPWKRGTEQAFWFSRAAWALKILVLWCAKTKDIENPVLWLPDYFCNQSTLPARDAGAQLIFYPIGPDLEPDWTACDTLAKMGKPDLFVLVHYFGKPADGEKARSFCDKVEASLIEDAAHVLGPIDDIGRYGDFIFYSPYKTFPVPDGAVLLVRDTPVATSISQITPSLPYNAPSPWAWRMKRILQKILPASVLEKRARARRPNFSNDPPLMPLAPTPRLSQAARRMLSHQGDKIFKMATARKSNANALRAKTPESPEGHPLFEAVHEGAGPYRFPMLYSDQERATGLFNFLSAKGCPVETWPDLPPEVTANPAIHAEAIKLRTTIVFFPVHQSVDRNQLTECCSVDERA